MDKSLPAKALIQMGNLPDIIHPFTGLDMIYPGLDGATGASERFLTVELEVVENVMSGGDPMKCRMERKSVLE